MPRDEYDEIKEQDVRESKKTAARFGKFLFILVGILLCFILLVAFSGVGTEQASPSGPSQGTNRPPVSTVRPPHR